MDYVYVLFIFIPLKGYVSVSYVYVPIYVPMIVVIFLQKNV